MFVGQYDHSLDSKNRVVLPAPFRAYVSDRGFATRLGSCIGLWNAEGFAAVAEKWKQMRTDSEMSAATFRVLMNNVENVKLDGAGRITLPASLLEGFESGAQVKVCGLFDRVEIWPVLAYTQEVLDQAATPTDLGRTVDDLGI